MRCQLRELDGRGDRRWRRHQHQRPKETGVRTITLPQCADTIWIQLDQFFELNILDAELLNEEGENSLVMVLPKLERGVGWQGGGDGFSHCRAVLPEGRKGSDIPHPTQ